LALLRKIANNIIIDRYRSNKVRKTNDHVSLDGESIPSITPLPEQCAITNQGIEAFNKKFKGFSKKCQRAYILSRFDGMTYDEIAQELGVSKSTVNHYIYTVLLELSEIVETYI
jgi:RNA polymerase sigma-70 factor (ECF subfamily)